MNQFPIFAKSENYELFDDEDKFGLSRGTLLLFTEERKGFIFSSWHKYAPFESKVSVFHEEELTEDLDTQHFKAFKIIGPDDPREYIDVELALDDFRYIKENILKIDTFLSK